MTRTRKIAGTAFGALLLLAASVILTQFLRAATLSRIAQTKLSVQVLQTASKDYFSVFSDWPHSTRDFTQNSSNIVFVVLAQVTNDAWGRPILYEPFDGARGYGQVTSYGRDGKPGGEGPDADIEAQFGP